MTLDLCILVLQVCCLKNENYSNGPKILDRQVWANSVDPDQAELLKEQPDEYLHCLPVRLHLLDTLP